MGLGINSQLPLQSLIRGMQDGDSQLAKNIERLSTGKQINSASDNPAGLVISEQLRALVGGLDKAIAANERTVNMVRAAEQFAGNVQDLLHQARGLVVDTANSGLADSSMREANQARLDQVIGSISRIADSAQFGTKKLLDGSMTITPLSQDGASGETTVDSMAAQDLGTDAQFANSSGDTVDVTEFQSLQDLASGALTSGNPETLSQALGVIDRAIEQVAGKRGELGAVESDLLGPATESLRAAFENLQAGASTVEDTDMALEMSKLTANKIKQEVRVSLMGQGQQAAQNLMRLLQSA